MPPPTQPSRISPLSFSKIANNNLSLSHFSKQNLQQPTSLLTVKIRQPSHEFTFGVGMTFVSYSLVLTPVV
jgi:hypothetical protein